MSKIISYDFGHMEGGEDGSANGYLYEYKVVRDYGKVCVDKLTNAGYHLVNCTPANGNISLSASLSYRTNHANASGSILHLCFHANAFKTTSGAMGAEIEVASDMGAKYGQSVLNEICKLGFKSRGVKRPSLYITGHTNMTAILIEPYFIDSKADCALYNPTTLGTSIANGVIKILGGTTTTVTTSTQSTPTETYTVRLSYNNKKSQLISTSDLYKAKDVANLHGGYSVYNSKGQNVYMLKGSTPPETYRIRLSFSDEKSQIGEVYTDYYQAKDFANLHQGYSVYNSLGKNLYTLAVKKPVKKVTPVKEDNTTYRIVAGSYVNESNADEQIEKLAKLGIDAFKIVK